MDVGLADWKKCRAIARRIMPSAQADDVDDLASDALLIVLQRGAGLRRAVIDALRCKYGRSSSVSREGRWRLHHPLPLTTPVMSRSNGNADDLAKGLGRNRPTWVRSALLLMSQGFTMKEAAQECGKVYDSLYSHLRR